MLTLPLGLAAMQISDVQSALPPYALPPFTFPFRQIAALAGRAPIGGAREVALGCFLAARLGADRLLAPLPEELTAARTVAARSWLATLALPTSVRDPLVRCLDLCGSGSVASLAAELRALSLAAAGFLDGPARTELDYLADRLAATDIFLALPGSPGV